MYFDTDFDTYIMKGENMNTYIIYKYTSPSGKVYIGETKQTKGDRSGGLFGNGYQHCTYFKHAIDKYGINNFTYEVLEDNLTYEEVYKREKYYIQLYDSTNPKKGYNITLGGRGCQLYDYEEIYQLYQQGYMIKEIAEKLGCVDSTIHKALNKYGVDGKERIKRSAGQYHIQTIAQYDKQHNLIKIYNSISDASRETGIHHSNIIANCKGRRKSAGGFIWEYFRT